MCNEHAIATDPWGSGRISSYAARHRYNYTGPAKHPCLQGFAFYCNSLILPVKYLYHVMVYCYFNTIYDNAVTIKVRIRRTIRHIIHTHVKSML